MEAHVYFVSSFKIDCLILSGMAGLSASGLRASCHESHFCNVDRTGLALCFLFVET